MRRGRKLAIVAHCILNANSRVDGLAGWEGVHPLVHDLESRGYGVIQLPCPEFEALGADRPARTREEYDTPDFRDRCDSLARAIVRGAAEYSRAGYRLELLVGVEDSPSCALDGLFVGNLRERLETMDVRFVAVDGKSVDSGISSLSPILETLE